MNVIAIEPSGNLYGSEYCLLDIIRGTTPLGVDWRVILPGGGGFDRVLAEHDVSSGTILPRESHALPLWKKARSYLRLRSELTSARPDLVYLNQAGMLRATIFALRAARSPLLCQVQTLEDAALVAANPTFQNQVTNFICNSRFIADASRLPANKTSIFYQPVLRPQRPKSGGPAPSGVWRIGIVGRIAASKGHWVFLEAASRLMASGMTNVEFIMTKE